MTCFITGGTGRLGSILVDNLRLRQETRVLVPDNSLLPDKCIPIKGDLNDIGALERGIAGSDVVFHLAASMDYNAPWSELEKVNVQGTKNVVEMCAKHRVRRLIFVSSTAVYGKELKEIPANEETPTNPTDLYGKSKLEAERVVGEHYSDVPYTIFRPGVMYGPTFIEYYSKVFNAIQHGRMRIFGDGKNVIPFVHASDVAEAMLRSAAYDVAKGKTYILSGNKSLTQEQIYGIAAQALGNEFKKQYTDPGMAKMMLAVSSIFGKSPITREDIDVLSSHRIFDTRKAENDLKWQCTPLETGIREMAGLYKARVLEDKKRKYLAYQREMLKQGKFVGRDVETAAEEPVPIPQPKPQVQPTQVVPQQPKPRYFQPMPKETAPEERPIIPAQMPPKTAAQPVQSAQPGPMARPEAKPAGASFFGISLSLGQGKSEKSQTTTYKPEQGSEKYTSSLSRMAPVVRAGGEPPKPPPSALKYMQPPSQQGQQQSQPKQSQQPSMQQRPIPPVQRPPVQQTQQPAQQRPGQPQAGKPAPGAGGGSWLNSVLKDIKKDSEKKDDNSQ